MPLREESYIGKGRVNLGLYGGGPLLPVGNCSGLEVSFDEEKQEQPNHMDAGGGNVNVVSKISSFTGSMTWLDFSAENLAKALRGAVTAVTSGTVTEEAHASAGVDNEFIPFDYPIDKTQAVTVVLTNDTALTLDVDYTLSNTGIIVIGAGSIDDTGIKASYTRTAGSVMESLIDAGQEFVLVFDGLNEAQSGDPTQITMHRIKLSPVSGLGFITDEFGEIPINFDVLSDSSIVATGRSKFMKIFKN